MLKKLGNWLLKSSADPARMSLMVRGILLAAVPTILGIVSAACGFGVTCLAVDQVGLNQLIEWIGAIVQAVFTVIAAIWFIYGLIRKISNTVNGWFGGSGYNL